MGDTNPIRTLGDYSKPSYEGYKNTIELPEGNNMENLSQKHGLVSRTYSKKSLIMASTFGSKSKSFMTMSLPPHDEPLTNRLVDFAKPVMSISLPQDVPITSYRRLIELEHQVQCLMEAYIAPMQPTQVNKITFSCEICSGPHDTQYCMENPEQVFVEYASSHTDEAGDARLTKFEADFKQQQSEMTNKIDTVLKAITDRIVRALPSDTVKNPKLNVSSTSLVLSARSYLTEDPQCSTQIHGLINTITVHQKQRDAPQLELKDPTDIKKIGPSKHNKEWEIEWLDVEEPLDLVDISEESIYKSLIKEMPKCSLNYDFRIKKGDLRNLKILCMIGHRFTANTYINVDLPINIMSLAYYNSVRKNRFEYRGRNFVRLGKDMHVFVGNMSYIMDFTILENIKTNINPSLSHVVFGLSFIKIACLAINRKHGLMTYMDGTKEITFTTPYKDLERSEMSSEGHDLLSSRIILSEDDYDRGCRKPFDLEDGFYRDTIMLGPEYVTGIVDEGEVT
ncbi:hypothetical protein Tco_1492250 [Tanacetum coccineum]